MTSTTSLAVPHSAPPAGPLIKGKKTVYPDNLHPILENIQTKVNSKGVQICLLRGGLVLPDISPEYVAGKMMVLLVISTRAEGDCGVCGGAGLVVMSLLTGSTGVAA